MNEQKTERKYAPLMDGEYYAKPYPEWIKGKNGKPDAYGICVNDATGNMYLAAGWTICDKDGNEGNFDMRTGDRIPLPEGYDGWEAPHENYLLAYGDESNTLAKCKSKPLEYIKDICPKTYDNMKRVMAWCPNWPDWHKCMWFVDCESVFRETVARITVYHEEWKGKMVAKVKWTNPKDRPAKVVDTTETRQKIVSAFGGFFDVSESAPAPKTKAPAPAPEGDSAPMPPKTKADCWATYCRYQDSKNTELWFSLIKAFGKKESEFTPADWGKLDRQIIETPPF